MKKYIHFWLLALCFTLASATFRSDSDKMLMEVICDSRPLLKETLKQAGLSALLMNPGQYTFFAPSDEGLQRMQKLDPGKMRDLFMNHLLEGKFTTDDLKDGTKMTTMGGATISVFRKRDQVLINGLRITDANMQAKNGVLHIVEREVVSSL